MKPILIYLLLINAASFTLMLVDMYKAKKNLWRIPEATLLGFAMIGGSFGALLGMRLVRHKTRHPRFYIGLPVLFVIHILILAFLSPHM